MMKLKNNSKELSEAITNSRNNIALESCKGNPDSHFNRGLNKAIKIIDKEIEKIHFNSTPKGE